MFERNIEGTLMELMESPETRYRYVIWFDYTRNSINEIQEGTLLAVPNFASTERVKRYSVLEITTILPSHYALQGTSSGYPGFVVEAARSASQDWESQEDTATEDTTKIRVVAIPTNLEIVENLENTNDSLIQQESNIPMIGSLVRVLDTEYTRKIANNGIDEKHESSLTKIGTITRDDNVDILLRIEELYRTHFALFGFTGVGKSNLLSTIVSKVFSDSDEPIKLVFFDLMSEYTGLLVDQLFNPDVHGRILTIGRNTLPEGTFRYLNEIEDVPSLDSALEQFARYTLLPKGLVSKRAILNRALRDLIENKCIRYFNEAQSTTVWDLFFTQMTPWGKERKGANKRNRNEVSKQALRTVLRGANYKETVFNPEIAKMIKEQLQSQLDEDGSFAEDFGPILSRLEELEQSTSESYAASTTMSDLVNDLNDNSHSSLWIIQAHNPDHLRVFSKKLGEEIYEQRRLGGIIEPLVSFIFDEADEFIRRDATGSYVDSAEIAQTLARRGRKFGLGIGIATQRIRYLDTNIMSQPHTYFVSKLPRKTDREAVSEAFGVGEEVLNQTFKFKKGNWLLMSHDATGLDAVPIPIKTENANDRIANWLDERYPNSESNNSGNE